MIKRLSKIFMISCLALVMIIFVGCNDNKEKAEWAQRITNRYARYQAGDAQKPFKYDDLYEMMVEKFGESNYGTVTVTGTYGETGIMYWIDGDYSKEEIEELINKGKKLKGLAISFADGLAVDAYYGKMKGWLY